VRSLNRDRGELMEQLQLLTRQKSALAEELINLRKETERQSDAILRQAKTKEEMMKEKAELAVQITACERENRQQSEVRINVIFISFEILFSTILLYFHRQPTLHFYTNSSPLKMAFNTISIVILECKCTSNLIFLFI